MFWKKKEIKKEEEIKKWDCKKDGHWYKIVQYPAMIKEENGKPKSLTLMLECKFCGGRHVTQYAFWNELPIMWRRGEIGLENYKELSNLVSKELTKDIKKWEEEQKSKINKEEK